jgi:hypothetical protein
MNQAEENHSTGPKVDDHWKVKVPVWANSPAVSLKCDVCGEPAVGSACSSTGPVSFAYCAECLRTNREPYSALIASMMGMKSLDQIAEWYRPIVLSNLKAEGKTLDEFFADTKKAREDWEEQEEREAAERENVQPA